MLRKQARRLRQSKKCDMSLVRHHRNHSGVQKTQFVHIQGVSQISLRNPRFLAERGFLNSLSRKGLLNIHRGEIPYPDLDKSFEIFGA